MDTRLRELRDDEGFDQVLEARVAVVYKHSDRCFTCRRALGEVRRVAQDWPGVPVYIVDVIACRALAAGIAARLEIRHESPQVILVQDGAPVWHGSHYAVTAEALGSEIEKLNKM